MSDEKEKPRIVAEAVKERPLLPSLAWERKQSPIEKQPKPEASTPSPAPQAQAAKRGG